MKYLVLDIFGGYYNLITDQEGDVVVFTDLASAQKEAEDCQEGIVIPIINIIDVLTRSELAISNLVGGNKDKYEDNKIILDDISDILNYK